MITAAFLSFTALILQVIPVIGISEEEGPRREAAWIKANTKINGTETNLFFSLSGVMFDQGGTVTNIDWSAEACDQNIDPGACNDCKDASQASYSTAILSLITAVPQFLTDLQRSTEAGDLNCQKMFGIVTGIVGFITTLNSILIYLNSCRDSLPTTNADGENVEYVFGASIICLTLATFMKWIDVFVHIIMPVPKRGESALAQSSQMELGNGTQAEVKSTKVK